MKKSLFILFLLLGGCYSLAPEEKEALNNLINVFGEPPHAVLPSDQGIQVETGEK